MKMNNIYSAVGSEGSVSNNASDYMKLNLNKFIFNPDGGKDCRDQRDYKSFNKSYRDYNDMASSRTSESTSNTSNWNNHILNRSRNRNNRYYDSNVNFNLVNLNSHTHSFSSVSSMKEKNKRISELERKLKRQRRFTKEKNRMLAEKDEVIRLQDSEIQTLKRKIEKLRQKRKRKSRNEASNLVIIEEESNNDEEAPDENLLMNVESEGFDEDSQNDINPDEMTYEELLELQEKIGFVPRGFTEEEIEKIPVFRYNFKKAKYLSINSKFCTICQYDYQKGDSLRQFQCLHAFHTDCVENWLKKEKLCPNCKEEILLD